MRQTPAHASDHRIRGLVLGISARVETVLEQNVLPKDPLYLPRVDHEPTRLFAGLATVLPEAALAAERLRVGSEPVRALRFRHGMVQAKENSHQVVPVPLAYLQVVTAQPGQAELMRQGDCDRPGRLRL